MLAWQVYDVSDWHEHPGGNVIFTHAGDDCTDIFAAFHPPGLQSMIDQVRKLCDEEPSDLDRPQ